MLCEAVAQNVEDGDALYLIRRIPATRASYQTELTQPAKYHWVLGSI